MKKMRVLILGLFLLASHSANASPTVIGSQSIFGVGISIGYSLDEIYYWGGHFFQQRLPASNSESEYDDYGREYRIGIRRYKKLNYWFSDVIANQKFYYGVGIGLYLREQIGIRLIGWSGLPVLVRGEYDASIGLADLSVDNSFGMFLNVPAIQTLGPR